MKRSRWYLVLLVAVPFGFLGLRMALDRVFFWYTLAMIGNVRGMRELANYDSATRVKWLEKASRHGDGDACWELGNLASGSNPQEALNYYLKGAELGDRACMVEMYKIYKYGLLGQARNAAEETRWKSSIDTVEKKRRETWIKDNHINREKYLEERRKADEKEAPHWSLGRFASRSNPQLALDHFRRGAESGSVDCMVELRDIYRDGLLGQPMDLVEAKLWEQKIDAIRGKGTSATRQGGQPVNTP